MDYRFASRDDAALILSFIKELAKYENLADEVTADCDTLVNEIFDKKRAEVIFALENGVETGFAVFCGNFSTFLGKGGIHLEDLYVKPEFRGKGYGKGLIKTLAKIACDRGCGRLEWSCLDWNKPSIDFYLSIGAVPLDGWTNYRLAGNTLEEFSKE